VLFSASFADFLCELRGLPFADRNGDLLTAKDAKKFRKDR
jgi:hypothetical protein